MRTNTGRANVLTPGFRPGRIPHFCAKTSPARLASTFTLAPGFRGAEMDEKIGSARQRAKRRAWGASISFPGRGRKFVSSHSSATVAGFHGVPCVGSRMEKELPASKASRAKTGKLHFWTMPGSSRFKWRERARPRTLPRAIWPPTRDATCHLRVIYRLPPSGIVGLREHVGARIVQHQIRATFSHLSAAARPPALLAWDNPSAF